MNFGEVAHPTPTAELRSSTMSAHVVVFEAPGCPACRMTERHLERRGISFAKQSLSAAADLIATHSLATAPVVAAVVDGVHRVWDGYRPDRIDALA